MGHQLSDFDFVEKIYLSGISARADEDISSLSPHERAVVIAWWAKGVIDNGGFSSLYESPVQIDDVERAFREVGATVAADTCLRSKEIFPNGEVPGSLSSRVSFVMDVRGDAGVDPWEQCDQVVWAFEDFDSSVANYVRSHRGHFAGLEA